MRILVIKQLNYTQLISYVVLRLSEAANYVLSCNIVTREESSKILSNRSTRGEYYDCVP